MLLFRVCIIALGVSLSACSSLASDHNDITAQVRAETLPFPSETPLIYIEQSAPLQSVAVVKSCAPSPDNCDAPKLKARSIRHLGPETYVWEFSDLKTCSGTTKLANLLISTNTDDSQPLYVEYSAGKTLTKTAQEHIAEELVDLITPCLSKSYMTPPWQR